jgi:hypothetical protein
MRILGLTFALLICAIAFPIRLVSGSDAVGVAYLGGTLATVTAKAEGHIRTANQNQLEFDTKDVHLRVPYDHINLLEYGQKADRRIAMAVLVSPLFLLSKSRQHFLSIGYTDDQGKEQAMVLRVSKGDIRSLLVSLEARTGLKVQFQDGEARKAGKG